MGYQNIVSGRRYKSSSRNSSTIRVISKGFIGMYVYSKALNFVMLKIRSKARNKRNYIKKNSKRSSKHM